MNDIRFAMTPCRGEPDVEVVAIFIDDVAIEDLVRAVELPFAERDGAPGIAGQYVGIPRQWMESPLRHFLGSPRPIFEDDGRTQIMGCECGEPGCWPLFCRIDVSVETVTWSDFRQPHRTGNHHAPWTYDGFGPFTFQRKFYEESLRALDTARSA